MNSANPPVEDNNSQDQPAPENKVDFESLYLRACADLENYRKQVEKDQQDSAKFASERFLITILPVLDNFKRAANHLPTELKKDEWVKGVTGIEKQFEQTLESLGLKKIEAKVGDACDANKHEAIATGEGESGKIIEVVEEGYELNEKVLRAAKVRVGSN